MNLNCTTGECVFDWYYYDCVCKEDCVENWTYSPGAGWDQNCDGVCPDPANEICTYVLVWVEEINDWEFVCDCQPMETQQCYYILGTAETEDDVYPGFLTESGDSFGAGSGYGFCKG